MSRVDEALRRARDFTPTLQADDRVEAGPSDHVPAPVQLDCYPREAPVAAGAMPAESAFRSAADDGRGTVPASLEFASESAPVFNDAPRFGQAYHSQLIAHASASPFSMEQYRRLAAAVHHLQGEQGLNRLMVSSSVPREGKTLTIANLALTLSESYKRRVLLIDADLRQPSLHQLFGIPNTDGLSEALQNETGEVYLAQISERLSVLPAGSVQGDPVQTLASARMAHLLEDMGSRFDWILLDAPPVTVIADTGLLVRLTRAVVLVIAAGSTPYTLVEKAAAELGRDNIVGTVLNRIDAIPANQSAYYVGFKGASVQQPASPATTPASSGL